MYMQYNCVYYYDTYDQSGHEADRCMCHMCICVIYIGVVSVVSQYNCVYYCVYICVYYCVIVSIIVSIIV
jgi:hypothetical protein